MCSSLKLVYRSYFPAENIIPLVKPYGNSSPENPTKYLNPQPVVKLLTRAT